MIPAEETLLSWHSQGRRVGAGEEGGHRALLGSSSIHSLFLASRGVLPGSQKVLHQHESNRAHLQGLAHSSPLLNPGIAQTGHITPPSGLLEPVHIAASASVIRCCNCLWVPEKSSRAEASSSHLLSQLLTVIGTQHMRRDHRAARLALVVVRRVLRNLGLAAYQGPLSITLQGYNLLGDNFIPHFPDAVLVIQGQHAQARLRLVPKTSSIFPFGTIPSVGQISTLL